jgi:hypothetical protein
MATRFQSFREFYPFYLSLHADARTRRLHFVGTSVAIAAIVLSIVMHSGWWVAAAVIAGYGFAWLGHWRYERNRPVTMNHPFYSFVADFVMYRDMLMGRIRW